LLFCISIKFVHHIKGRIYIKRVSEQGAEEYFGPNTDEVEG